jgi:hypothetical protein
MNAIVIEHVPVEDLPEAWRARLAGPMQATVTVRIEEDIRTPAPEDGFVTDDPAFGIWRDRQDIQDVEEHVRKLRAPRYNRDGSRNQP